MTRSARLRRSPLIEEITLVFSFLKKMGVKLDFFFFSVVLSALAILCQVAVIRLLFPLARGLMESDFTFVRGMRGLNRVVSLFPGLFDTSTSLFILLVLTIFAASVTKNMFLYTAGLTARFQAKVATRNIRVLLFSRYLKFGKRYFDHTGTGTIASTLLNFSSRITSQIILLQQTFGQVLSLVVYVGILFAISWKMTLIVLIIFPALNLTSHAIIQNLKRASREHVASLTRLNDYVYNIVSCIPIVKAFTRERVELKHFSEYSDREVALSFAMDKKNELIKPVQDITMLTALLLAASAMPFVASGESAGEISAYLVFFFVLHMSIPAFGALTRFRTNISRAHGPIQALLGILANEGKHIVPEGTVRFTGLTRAIEMRDLTFAYVRGKPVLRDIHLTIRKGLMTAIVGPTGAGKTTLLHLIMRFYDCPPGALYVDGQDIRGYTHASLRRNVAFVSQDIYLFNDTLRYNLTYQSDSSVTEQKLIEIVKKARLYDFIMSLPHKLETRIGERGVQLSGGEKQRVAIARALLKGSDTLLLDEATSSLDTKTESLIQEAIAEAVRDKTIIAVAHRLSTIAHADKIVFLDRGRIIEEGTFDELMGLSGRFREYWQAQHSSKEVYPAPECAPVDTV